MSVSQRLVVFINCYGDVVFLADAFVNVALVERVEIGFNNPTIDDRKRLSNGLFAQKTSRKSSPNYRPRKMTDLGQRVAGLVVLCIESRMLSNCPSGIAVFTKRYWLQMQFDVDM